MNRFFNLWSEEAIILQRNYLWIWSFSYCGSRDWRLFFYIFMFFKFACLKETKVLMPRKIYHLKENLMLNCEWTKLNSNTFNTKCVKFYLKKKFQKGPTISVNTLVVAFIFQHLTNSLQILPTPPTPYTYNSDFTRL